CREGNEIKLVIRNTLAALAVFFLHAVEKVSHEEHSGLAVTEVTGSIRILCPQKVRMEGLYVNQLLEHLTRLHKCWAVEALSGAIIGRFEGLLAPDSQRKHGPVEVQGPFVAAPCRERCNPGGLTLLYGVDKAAPSGQTGWIHSGFFQEFLVEPQNLKRGLHRRTIDLALIGEGFDTGRTQSGRPFALHRFGDVLAHSGPGLVVKHAAGPTVKEVRPLLGL